jgi:hypothetical protein
MLSPRVRAHTALFAVFIVLALSVTALVHGSFSAAPQMSAQQTTSASQVVIGESPSVLAQR